MYDDFEEPGDKADMSGEEGKEQRGRRVRLCLEREGWDITVVLKTYRKGLLCSPSMMPTVSVPRNSFIIKLYVLYVLTFIYNYKHLHIHPVRQRAFSNGCPQPQAQRQASAVKSDDAIHGRGVIRVNFKIGIVWQFRDLCPALTDNPHSRA